MDQVSLFDEPPRTPATLSHITSREATHGAPVQWRKLMRHNVTCDECLALQYETKGRSTFHGPARIERHHKGTMLYLCWTHAELWKARDRGD